MGVSALNLCCSRVNCISHVGLEREIVRIEEFEK